MPSLTEYEAFVAIVEEGNLSRAAARLYLTKSAVSKQLSKMEDRLGVGLIDRTTQALVVTTQGLQFYSQCKEILLAVQTCEDNLKNTVSEAKGKLHISFSQVLLQSPLVKLLAKFHQRYPDIVCDMRVDDSFEDLMSEQIDFAFRLSHQEDSHLVAHPVTKASLIFCASPNYIEQHGKPRHIKSLSSHKMIVPTFDRYIEPTALQRELEGYIDRTTCHSSNDLAVLIQAAIEGMGIVAVLDITVREHLARGDLVDLFPSKNFLNRTLYLVSPRQNYIIKRREVFKEFILEKMSIDTRSWFCEE